MDLNLIQKYKQLISKKSLFGITLVFIQIYFFTFYGWSDDVILSQTSKGMFSNQPLENMQEQFLYLSDISNFLNSFFPSTIWFSSFLIFLGLSSTFLFFKVTNLILERFKFQRRTKFLILLLAFFGFFYENLFLLTFTRLSILCSALSLILLVNKSEPKGYKFWLGCSFLFLLGFFVRFQVAIFGVVIVSFTVLLLKDRLKRITSYNFFAAISFSLILLAGNLYLNDNSNSQKYFVRWSYLTNFLDGFNADLEKKLQEPDDSIRIMALANWFLYDEVGVPLSFLRDLGGNNPFTIETLSKSSENIYNEYHKSKYFYSNDYHYYLNWDSKIIVYLGLNLFLIFLVLISGIRGKPLRNLLIKEIALFFIYFLLILIVTIFFKMEDRFFSPISLVFTLCHLTLLSFFAGHFDKSKSRILFSGLLLLCFLYSSKRIYEYGVIIQEKRGELNKKLAIIDDLNSRFTNKLLFFDYWSMTLIHQRPYQNIDVDTQNKSVAWGEFHLNAFNYHKEYLKEICGVFEFAPFYDCLYEKGEEVVFVFGDYRKNLMEDYLRILYDRRYKFVSIGEGSPIQDIKYSFFWGPINFDYYKLVKIESDEE